MHRRQILKLTKGKSYGLNDYAKREVNLLPNDFHKIAKAKLTIIASIALFIIFCSVFAFYEYTVIMDTDALIEDTEQMRYIISDKQQEIENQNIIISLGNRIELKEVLLNFIFSTNRSIVHILDTFESSLNGEIYLNSLTANSHEMFVINASATSHEAISHLINQLKLLDTLDDEKYFSEVFTNGINRTADDDGNVLYLFQLNCKFEGGIVDEIK